MLEELLSNTKYFFFLFLWKNQFQVIINHFFTIAHYMVYQEKNEIGKQVEQSIRKSGNYPKYRIHQNKNNELHAEKYWNKYSYI